MTEKTKEPEAVTSRNRIMVSWVGTLSVLLCVICGLLIGAVTVLYGYPAFVFLVGSMLAICGGLAAWRCLRLQEGGVIRFLSGALGFVYLLMALRGGTYLVDLFHGEAEDRPPPTTLLAFADVSLTGVLLTAIAGLGVILFLALDPSKNRAWLQSQVGFFPVIGRSESDVVAEKLAEKVAEDRQAVSDKLDEQTETMKDQTGKLDNIEQELKDIKNGNYLTQIREQVEDIHDEVDEESHADEPPVANQEANPEQG